MPLLSWWLRLLDAGRCLLTKSNNTGSSRNNNGPEKPLELALWLLWSTTGQNVPLNRLRASPGFLRGKEKPLKLGPWLSGSRNSRGPRP
jgi:hypothetical protein